MAGGLTPRRRVVLAEFGAPEVVALPAAEADAVRAVAADWQRRLGLRETPFTVARAGDETAIAARHVTGVVRVGGLDIEIVPKFLGRPEGTAWRAALWRILTVVEADTATLALTSAEAVDTTALADLVADAFVHAYRIGSARGLPRVYREVATVAPVLRGTLDRRRVGDWIARPWQVPVLVDELTEDTDVARLLRWTARELARAVSSPRRARTLRDIAAALPAPPVRVRHRPRLGPQHLALAPAVRIGLLLAEGRGLEHGAGDAELGGFLWRSDDIYERYVFHLCATAARTLGLHAEKRAVRFALPETPGTRPLSTTPDVVVRARDGGALAIVDAKYKVLGAAPRADDAYQVVVGALAAGCGRAALTYPVSGDVPVRRWRTTWAGPGGDVEITALPLPVLRSATPDGVQALVGTFAGYLRGQPVAASTAGVTASSA